MAAIGCGDEGLNEQPAGLAPADSFVLDFEGTPEAAGRSPSLAVRRDGARFAVAPSWRPSAILIFDERGRYVEAAGRRGPGPGELGSVAALAFDAADSLWVFGRGRVDIWSPDFEPVRSMPVRILVQGEVAMARDGSGAFVVGSSGDPSMAQVRVRFLSRDGDLRPLERETRVYVADELGSENRSVVASDSGYWVANFHEWDIRHLDLQGDTLARLDDPPSWWQPLDVDDEELDMDTSPSILDIGLDEGGRLWVLAGVLIADRDALQAVREGDRSQAVVRAIVDHVLRVYDGSTLELLSERRFDYFPLAFLDRRLGYTAQPEGDSVVVSLYSLDALR